MKAFTLITALALATLLVFLHQENARLEASNECVALHRAIARQRAALTDLKSRALAADRHLSELRDEMKNIRASADPVPEAAAPAVAKARTPDD